MDADARTIKWVIMSDNQEFRDVAVNSTSKAVATGKNDSFMREQREVFIL